MPLTPQSQRNFAQRLIISGVRSGLSGNSILQSLRAVDLGYRTQVFYVDYNRYKNTDVRLPRVNTAEYHTYLQDNFIMKVPARKGNRFQYTFSVYGTDNTTGETVQRFFSTTSNRPLIPDVAQAAVESGVDFGSYGFAPDMGTLELNGVYNYVSQESI